MVYLFTGVVVLFFFRSFFPRPQCIAAYKILLYSKYLCHLQYQQRQHQIFFSKIQRREREKKKIIIFIAMRYESHKSYSEDLILHNFDWFTWNCAFVMHMDMCRSRPNTYNFLFFLLKGNNDELFWLIMGFKLHNTINSINSFFWPSMNN